LPRGPLAGDLGGDGLPEPFRVVNITLLSLRAPSQPDPPQQGALLPEGPHDAPFASILVPSAVSDTQ
jgi:hypothetical protein